MFWLRCEHRLETKCDQVYEQKCEVKPFKRKLEFNFFSFTFFSGKTKEKNLKFKK